MLNTELLGSLEANEAAIEYHDGKFDPSMLKHANPKNLKKKQIQSKKANVWVAGYNFEALFVT